MINIYKASAGSGKTFTLAREYIKLILGHKNLKTSPSVAKTIRNGITISWLKPTSLSSRLLEDVW